MIGNTNALVFQNPKTTLWSYNASGTTVSRGDKVLLKQGQPAQTPQSFTEQTSNFNPVCVLDNQTFLTTGANFANLYQLSSSTWSATSTSGFANVGLNAIYTYHHNGTVAFFDTAQVKSDRTGYLITSSAVTTLPYNSLYLGENSSGTHFVFQTNTGQYAKVRAYTPETNDFAGARLTIENSSGYFYFGFVSGDNCILTTGGSYAYLYQTDDTNFVYLNKTSISGYFPLFATGTAVGDILFVTDNINYNYYNLNNTTANAHLFCYQIQNDYSLQLVTIPYLQQFATTACYAQYDHRNNTLCVSTVDKVYLFEFNTTTKTFSEKIVFVDTLPTIAYSAKPLRAAFLPNKNYLLIMSRYNYLNVYPLGADYYRIMPNAAANYHPEACLTGYATGEVDNNGYYEIQVADEIE